MWTYSCDAAAFHVRRHNSAEEDLYHCSHRVYKKKKLIYSQSSNTRYNELVVIRIPGIVADEAVLAVVSTAAATVV